MHKMTTSTNKKNDVVETVKGPKRSTEEIIKKYASASQCNVELPRGAKAETLH